MSNAALQSLQIRPDAADPELAQEQARFNTLVRDVALWRAALDQWNALVARYRQTMAPIHRELHAAWRQWVFALDHASLQPGLVRAEREQLGELLRVAASALLEVEDDAGIAEVASRHAQASSRAQPGRDDRADAIGEAAIREAVTPDWEQQAAAAAHRRAERAAQRRAATALKRRTKAQQEVSQSLRDVYRRLASALHPDREPEARQQERKTRLMQLANHAYAEGNLLALLELQLQAEQIDAAHLAGVDLRRLQHYVTVLQEQLADLQSETRRVEADFRAAVGVAPGWGLQARKAERLISAEARRLQGELLLLRRQARLLLDAEATRNWLREQRKA